MEVRVMALHALEYCERLFFLEEVEEIRVADHAVFAGRTLHQELQDEDVERGEWKSFTLSSATLQLTGKMDALRRRDGAWIPYEHKKGRARKTDEGYEAWFSDVLQIAAYTMLLEEEKGCSIHEARIRYHESATTVRIPVDENVRQKVRDAVERAQELRASLRRPPISKSEKKCLRCSLAPVCLPEEERLLEDKEWTPIRLFPADDTRKTLHITQHDARISRSGDTLQLKQAENKKTFPLKEVGSIVFHGYPQITTQALHRCAYEEIGLHWLTTGGRHIASLCSSTGGVQRKVRQYQGLDDKGCRRELAARLIHAKVENARRYLLRGSQGMDRKSLGLQGHLDEMQRALKKIELQPEQESLRGYEGLAARAYFSALPSLFKEEVPVEMHPKGRSRRPPKDRFNALLGFGYALLYQRVLQAVIVVGLEPALGFFHTPRSSAHPLVLDLMELFRLPLWDIPLIASVNRQQWDPEEDFDIAGTRVWLAPTGKKKAIQLFERRLQDTWKHPVVGYSLSYARLLELEVRLLEKEWSGSPGLFAKMRLR